jgi:hypothetical protein
MKLPNRSALLGAALLCLAACGSASDEADQRTAVGEILPGSATDAMIKYDQLRSQPPLAKQTGTGGGGGADAEPAAGDAPSDAAQGEAVVPEDSDPTEPADEAAAE